MLVLPCFFSDFLCKASNLARIWRQSVIYFTDSLAFKLSLQFRFVFSVFSYQKSRYCPHVVRVYAVDLTCNFIWTRDVGTKFQSSESLSHLIASVLILQEPKTAENRKLSWENDEAQTIKTEARSHNQKNWLFFDKIPTRTEMFSWFCKKQIKGIIFCLETLIFG